MRQTVKFDATPASARHARDIVRSVVEGQPIGSRILDTALLLTSELVVNAAKHGKGEVTLEVVLQDKVLRVAVTDGGPGDPIPQHGDEQLHELGRGLALVEDLATRWGVAPSGAVGKTVWFELVYVASVD